MGAGAQAQIGSGGGIGDVTLNGTQTLTNKRITKRVLAVSAPGATPAIDTDNYDVVHFTGLATGITSLTTNLTGTPVDGDTLRMSFTDNGTSQTIVLGSAWEPAVELPLKTVAGVRLDTVSFWNTETGKWRMEGVAPGPVTVYQDLGNTNVALSGTATTVLDPTLTVGTWLVLVALSVVSESAVGATIVAAIAGGSAAYTVIGPASGTVGGKSLVPTSTASDNGSMLSFPAIVVVTTAGTVDISAQTSSGTASVKAQDTEITTTQISTVTALQIG